MKKARHSSRLALVAVAAISLAIALVTFGCKPASQESAKPEDFYGTWVISSMDVDGETVSFNGEDDEMFAMGLSVSEDGMAYFFVGSEVTADEYSIKGNTLTIKDALDGTTMPFRLKNGVLSLDWNDVKGPARDEAGLDGNVVLRFTRTHTDSNAKQENYLGKWTGYDVMLSDGDGEPMALADIGMSSSLIINNDLTGRLVITMDGDEDVYDLRLEQSTKTYGYVAYVDGSAEPQASLSYLQSEGGTDWLTLTIILDDGSFMQFSYTKE